MMMMMNTSYGLDGPDFESLQREASFPISKTFTLARASSQRVPGSFSGGNQSGSEVDLLLETSLGMGGAITPLPIYAFMV